jgi:hypothetical protein
MGTPASTRPDVAATLFGLLLACGTETREDEGASAPASASSVSADTGAADTAADGTAADGDGDGGGVKLDLGGGFDLGDGNGGDCPGGGGMVGDDVEFSYIWIASSPEGTVSKIDTRTGVEIARYATGPASQAEPSRTSVNLYGDVAVSNRGSTTGGPGGVTKIVARAEDCTDADASGVIETSTGPSDVLPWGSDECVKWNLEIPSDMYQHGPRPTAWEGKLDEGCASPSPRLWMGWYRFADNTGVFHRVNGGTGEIEDTVEVPELSGLDFGPYGGAVNKDGDFWVNVWQTGPLIHIDGDTLEVAKIPIDIPPLGHRWAYGMALDQYGNPWVATAGAAAKYDVASATWQFATTSNDSMRGVMVDKADRAWFAVDGSVGAGCGVGIVDVGSMEVVASAVPLPGCVTPVGVSIDIDGFVWVVDQGANSAFKIDPDSRQVELTVTGLTQPYTYSDMTGAGLDLVVNPPAG